MPEIIIPGPEGRLEARYHKSDDTRAPICLVLHPHPRQGGTMNNKLVYNTYQAFKKSNFSTLKKVVFLDLAKFTTAVANGCSLFLFKEAIFPKTSFS